MVLRPVEQPAIAEVIQTAVADVSPVGFRAIQVQHDTGGAWRPRLITTQFADLLVGFETEILKKCPGIGGRSGVETAPGGLYDRSCRKRSVPVPPHAVGNHDQMGVMTVQTQHFQAVLLFGTPANIRSQTKLPWHDLRFLVVSGTPLHH